MERLLSPRFSVMASLPYSQKGILAPETATTLGFAKRFALRPPSPMASRENVNDRPVVFLMGRYAKPRREDSMSPSPSLQRGSLIPETETELDYCNEERGGVIDLCISREGQ
jgi:hypothetical protein